MCCEDNTTKKEKPQTAQEKWFPLTEIHFDSTCMKSLFIDTRDFGCKPRWQLAKLEIYKQLPTLKKYGDQFFFTIDELQKCLTDLYNASGGEIKWRYLQLKEGDSWHMKYLHAYLTPYGWVLGNRNDRFFKKEFWCEVINNSLLNQPKPC